jgi:putative transposase
MEVVRPEVWPAGQDEDGQMGTKRHKPEDVVAKLRQADVLIAQGQSVADVIRTLGVTEVTYYRWRKEFGGLKTDQVRRMKDLELENQRLRKAVADLTLDKLILQEAARGNFFSIRGSLVNSPACASLSSA